MAVIYPPKQGQAYAAPDGSNCCKVQHRLTAQDCAVLTRGTSMRIDKTRCVNGPGVVEYTCSPGVCTLAIIEGCTMSSYVLALP
jgi:hypothetical protein